jgi:hypothetical protein
MVDLFTKIFIANHLFHHCYGQWFWPPQLSVINIGGY